MSKTETYYLRWRGKVSGPFSWAEIERKLDAHEIGLLHDFQHNNDWITLGEFLERRGDSMRVNVPFAAAPTAADLRADAQLAPPLLKSPARTGGAPNRWIFVALGLVAGFLGIHDFYAHHWIRGALLLAVTVLLWLLNWGILWPWIWAIGEIILTKIDGKGRRMRWK
jgi:TM2 domain-containing membrane protein YozV